MLASSGTVCEGPREGLNSHGRGVHWLSCYGRAKLLKAIKDGEASLVVTVVVGIGRIVNVNGGDHGRRRR